MRISDWSSDVCSSDLDAAEVPAGTIRIIDIPNAAPATPGTPDPRNAVAVIAALEGAAAACITGTFDGLVTGPVPNSSINAGAIAYPGTNRPLARHAGCEVVMTLANDIVRVALAPTPCPPRAVAHASQPDNLC